MKIDVTDLFDHFHDVAMFARSRFDLSEPYKYFELDEPQPEDGWLKFCEALSDSLFLPACVSRVFAITHMKIASSGAEEADNFQL